MIARLETKFTPCNDTIVSRLVSHIFLGKILLAVPVVHYQTSYLKMLAVILMMKEILRLLTPLEVVHKHCVNLN